MKSRRNRHIFSGGVGEPQAQPIQEAVPLDVNDPNVDAEIKADANSVVDGLTITARTGNENIDDEVEKLTGEEGYYFRAFINAIGICNSSMKAKHNLLNPLNSELIVCGEQCHKRADIIRKTIERLIPYLQRSDALGYIGSERVLANTGTYLKNSAASLASKGYKGLMNAPGAIANAPSAIKTAAYNAPSSLLNTTSTGLTNIGKSMTAASNYFTRKAPQATQSSYTDNSTKAAVGTSLSGSSGFFGFGGKTRRRR